MHKSLMTALLLTAAPLLPGTAIAQDNPAAEIASAAQAYLDTLDRDQLGAAMLPFPSTAVPAQAEFSRSGGGGGGRPASNFTGERYGASVWSNYPASDVLRPGLPLGDMTEEQRAAAMALLQAALSPELRQGSADHRVRPGAARGRHQLCLRNRCLCLGDLRDTFRRRQLDDAVRCASPWPQPGYPWR